MSDSDSNVNLDENLGIINARLNLLEGDNYQQNNHIATIDSQVRDLRTSVDNSICSWSSTIEHVATESRCREMIREELRNMTLDDYCKLMYDKIVEAYPEVAANCETVFAIKDNNYQNCNWVKIIKYLLKRL